MTLDELNELTLDELDLPIVVESEHSTIDTDGHRVDIVNLNVTEA